MGVASELTLYHGEPVLSIAGFKLWVHGREDEENSDYWDGNWLVVSAVCETDGAVVWLEEQTALHGSEVASFVTACNLLARGQTEEAVLGGSLEPYFSLTLAPGEKRGRFSANLSITPDVTTQSHDFEFAASLAEVEAVLESARRLLDQWPVVGAPYPGGEGAAPI